MSRSTSYTRLVMDRAKAAEGRTARLWDLECAVRKGRGSVDQDRLTAALERLVADGRLERSREGARVYYSVPAGRR